MATDEPREDVVLGPAACGDVRGRYRCTRPAGHEGNHWFAAVIASWEHSAEWAEQSGSFVDPST